MNISATVQLSFDSLSSNILSRMYLQQFLYSQQLADSQRDNLSARSCGSPDSDSFNSSFSSSSSSETNNFENFESKCQNVSLSFSIEKILHPKFGMKSSPKKKEEDLDLPIDLSHTSNLPPGMMVGPGGDLVPAWVFCTRYSDRPSAGRARKTKRKSGPGSLTCQDKKQRTVFNIELSWGWQRTTSRFGSRTRGQRWRSLQNRREGWL